VNKGRDLDVNDTRQIALSLAEMRGVQLPAAKLSTFANPPLEEADRRAAEIEGWILGVM
jgi:hypothetical protein